MAAFMATYTEHSTYKACTAPRRNPAQPVIMRADSDGSNPTRGSDLAYGTPRPPQESTGASGGGGGALVPGLCPLHRTLQDRALYHLANSRGAVIVTKERMPACPGERWPQPRHYFVLVASVLPQRRLLRQQVCQPCDPLPSARRLPSHACPVHHHPLQQAHQHMWPRAANA